MFKDLDKGWFYCTYYFLLGWHIIQHQCLSIFVNRFKTYSMQNINAIIVILTLFGENYWCLWVWKNNFFFCAMYRCLFQWTIVEFHWKLILRLIGQEILRQNLNVFFFFTLLACFQPNISWTFYWFHTSVRFWNAFDPIINAKR